METDRLSRSPLRGGREAERDAKPGAVEVEDGFADRGSTAVVRIVLLKATIVGVLVAEPPLIGAGWS
ncbi:hypothetical protein [Tautonia sociabilis]|uniref:Uncharacterized protein n=1 Tax=Tautonia sociabilis TaxID=2080755 RepID=A0A432MPR2_9BACT|nr:hypothetical protein [Tautonia sociabilis]RUL89444.1 hypothetical protein TsocGM_01340 [Tautonia sociabilis]